MRTILFIFLGGGLGSCLRYGTQCLLNEHILPYQIPWTTLTVNIVGSFLIGFFYALSSRYSFHADYKLLLTTGLCGGFTTFSTLSHDALNLLKSGLYVNFSVYLLTSIILGLVAVYLGYMAVGKSF